MTKVERATTYTSEQLTQMAQGALAIPPGTEIWFNIHGMPALVNVGGGVKLKRFFTWLIWIILFVALVLFLWWFVISPWIWQNSDKFETFSQSKVIR